MTNSTAVLDLEAIITIVLTCGGAKKMGGGLGAGELARASTPARSAHLDFFWEKKNIKQNMAVGLSPC